MGDLQQFDEIRPYRDQEVPAVVERLIANPGFYSVMQYAQPHLSEKEVVETVSSVKTIDDFQAKVAHPAMRHVIDNTIDSVTVSGLENLKKGESYLFISNHRDIILDSALLNILLYEARFGTIETAIGSNLLSSKLVADLTKLNKNFVVKRNTGVREFYENSMLLSSYIRHTIAEAKNSIWIAQREGRTKDGIDKTQPGLLKMLSINCEQPLRYCFRELRVTPVAISYEYDPCDVLKVPELKAISRDEKYEKAPEEDLKSILTGLTGRKGRVHVAIGQTIDKELEVLADFPNLNDKLRLLGEFIDQQIYQNYKLWPSNYMALDLLNGTRDHTQDYQGQNIEAFEKLLKERIQTAGLNAGEDYQWVLKMYANPVINHLSLAQS